MELPRRSRGDELLKSGELIALRERLRRISRQHDLATVIACAFDHRTRMLPFIFADLRMAPAGVRAIGSAMADVGFAKTRIVLQQWNRNFRPSRMQLDGRMPDLFMISSMQIHSRCAEELIRDACQIDPDKRPLIIAGGPKYIYEPWDIVSTDPKTPWAADVAITGEEFVVLSLLERILENRSPNEPIRQAFHRVRDQGLLDDIPGLVYPRVDKHGQPFELIDTGIQRLLGDLDETPHPALGYQLLEPPSHAATLASRALPPEQVRRYTPLGSLVLTFGCKFSCPYCPIPAYNQRQHRNKSGARIADEMVRLYREFGLQYFFGADDNFFNRPQRTLDIIETLANTEVDGKPFRNLFRWATEVTVHDTLEMRYHLRSVRKAGVRALWLGVEDMTGKLVRKGQSVDRTCLAFQLLRDRGISPMPMMMHSDQQPLYSWGRPDGLINQIQLLRRSGAISMQVLMITPATGSRTYEEAFTSGLLYDSVHGQPVQTHMLDGNYVVASRHPQPWRKQLNIMLSYAYFYNPFRMAWAMIRPKSRLYLADSGMQVLGMWGLSLTIRKTIRWVWHLWRGAITRKNTVPTSLIPMRAPDGSTASHKLQPPQSATIEPETVSPAH